MTQAHDRYRALFAERRSHLPGGRLPWLARAREAALEHFAELGFPTTRDEDWKYTNVAPIERRAFGTWPPGAHSRVESMVRHLSLEGSDLLVFVNGYRVPELCRIGPLPAGARVRSLGDAFEQDSDELEPALRCDEGAETNGFAALNSALWTDGSWVEVEEGAVLERPIHLLFLTAPGGNGVSEGASFVRNLIRIGAGSRATVVEHFAGTDDRAYLTDATTRVELGEHADFSHAKLQQEGRRGFHIAEIGVEQGEESRYASQSFAFGGVLSRSEIVTRLSAEGCMGELLGLYMAGGRQHHDHHTSIEHIRPRGTSREFYKGVLDGNSRAVFNGRVVVHPGAARTDAQQSNRNLLLSEGAEVDTKPQLEIYADDVKCAHGATVGQLDADQLHYLRSRGLDEPAARAVLIHAFAAEVVERVAFAPLRARLQAMLPGRLSEETRKLLCEPRATR